MEPTFLTVMQIIRIAVKKLLTFFFTFAFWSSLKHYSFYDKYVIINL